MDFNSFDAAKSMQDTLQQYYVPETQNNSQKAAEAPLYSESTDSSGKDNSVIVDGVPMILQKLKSEQS